jgi:hypothetical protein
LLGRMVLRLLWRMVLRLLWRTILLRRAKVVALRQAGRGRDQHGRCRQRNCRHPSRHEISTPHFSYPDLG